MTKPLDAHPAEPVAVEPVTNVWSDDTVATTPAHDKDMASSFLAGLDPSATRFTFQFFSDRGQRYAEILHGSLDEVWPKIPGLNTPQRGNGAFVTINETDFAGRNSKNILRARALFVDADSPEQIDRCIKAFAACGVNPSMVVKSGRGAHFYFCTDVPRDQFSALQKSLIDKVGTDAAVKDLPRVMRLPGTLHLKNAAKPRLVKLLNPANRPVERWELSELVAKMGLSPTEPVATSNVVPFQLPDWAINGKPSQLFADLPHTSLADGLEPNIEEIRSAVEAIPPSAIATEPEWMRLARALAHEAAVFKKLAEPLWDVLDAASCRAPGYNEADNRSRWLRYIGEALNRPKPITLGTVFHMALEHGWDGRPTSNVATSNAVTRPVNPCRAVHISSLPLVPPKRQWLHGTDLIRGAVTMLVAPGGRAKSTWLLTCALACASGRPLLGSHVFGGPLRVLCLSTEDGMPELALRLRAAMKHYKLTDADVPGLYVIGADRWGLPLLQMEGNRAVLDRRGIDALTVELEYIKPDVLIIDPLITVMGGVNANDNPTAAVLMGHLAALTATRRIAVALAHHTSKGRDLKSAESAMGAATFINLARIALAIEPLEEKDAGTVGLPPWEARSIFRVLGTKQNFSPPNAEDRWFQLISIDMPNADPPIYMNGDQVAVVEPFQPGSSGPAFPPELIRDALGAVDSANPLLSPSKQAGDRYGVPIIAQAIASHRGGHASDIEGKSVLDHLIASGLVRVADIKLARSGSRSDTRKCLVLTHVGKAALRQSSDPASNTPPQSPQCPATTLQENAGGDPLGPPQRQGGYGGNAGQ